MATKKQTTSPSGNNSSASNPSNASGLSNLGKYKSDLQSLISIGDELHLSIQYECYPDEIHEQLKDTQWTKEKISEFKKKIKSFKEHYEDWYSESKSLITQLLPERREDFVKLYEKPRTRKAIAYDNYVIQDYLQGLNVTRGWEKEKVVGPEAAIPQFRQQLNILKSINRRFESSLFDIKQLAQADLFDSELDAATELLKNKFERAAGVIAGVVLEKHLGQVCANHSITVSKKDPGIGDYNDLLKNNSVIDVPTWRFIQRLGDIRNLCGHNKSRDPKREEVEELINGVSKISKTVM